MRTHRTCPKAGGGQASRKPESHGISASTEKGYIIICVNERLFDATLKKYVIKYKYPRKKKTIRSFLNWLIILRVDSGVYEFSSGKSIKRERFQSNGNLKE